MAKLTDAGFRMIEKYLEHKSYVENAKPCPYGSTGFNPRAAYTTKCGQIFMTLAPGDGAAAMTIRKMVRDGFAIGTFNWGSQSRYMIPTEAGLAAYWDRRMQERHESDLARSFG